MMGGFLQKQGKLLLRNERYAFILAAMLAFFPLTDCFSLSVIALITLRKGALAGVKVLAAGMLTTAIALKSEVVLPYTMHSALLTFVSTWLMAVALHYTGNWKMTVWMMLLGALLAVFLVHAFAPFLIIEQFKALLILFKSLDSDSVMIQTLDAQSEAFRDMLANYLLGVKAFSIIFSAVTSLMMARYIQSSLFNPGGFRQEVLSFRATQAGLILLLICLAGVYQGNAVAASCLPLLALYLMMAGMALLYNMLSKKRDWLTVALLFVPLFVAPYVMLPLYVLCGSLDTIFNFRLRFALKAAE